MNIENKHRLSQRAVECLSDVRAEIGMTAIGRFGSRAEGPVDQGIAVGLTIGREKNLRVHGGRDTQHCREHESFAQHVPANNHGPFLPG